jgi:hypothetical protein
MWETSITATNSSGSSLAAYAIIDGNYSGVAPIYEPSDLGLAPFLMGWAASLDFAATAGRTTAAFRSLTGITPSVTDAGVADQLRENGYNYYGDYATGNDQFQFFYPGSVTGPFLWLDSYVNQIQLNNALQLALMTFLTSARSVPYNSVGYSMIEAACADPINAALNYGTIQPGVTLSASQIAQVNAAAGRRISDTLSQRGWYLIVTPATPEQRAARASPPITLFYMDGQSVQQLALASIAVQ